MGKRRITWILALLFVLGAAGWAYAGTETFAGPHNNYTEGVDCGHCHLLRNYSSPPPWWPPTPPINPDDTVNNGTCLSCHNDMQARGVRTHSSTAVGRNQWPIDYPIGWQTECVDCHFGFGGDSHGTHIMKNFAGAKLVEGEVTGATYNATSRRTVLTLGNFTSGDLNSKASWANYIIYTNSDTRSYQIKASSGNTVTVKGDASGDLNTGFYIIYGQYLNSDVGITNDAPDVLNVHFFDNNGTHGFIDESGDGGYGICETCHTKTRFFRNSPRGSAGHVAGTENCTTCHTHRDGFGAEGCYGCHGQSTQSGYPSAAGELVDPPTGEALGAHAKHIPAAGGDTPSACDVCHNNHNMPVSDLTIHIEFSGVAGTTGTFDGATSLSNSYSYGGPGIPGTLTGTRTCSNVACHEDGRLNLVATPAWDDPAVPACSACHEARPSTGSHTAHLDDPVNPPVCGNCHLGAVEGTTAPAGHRDGNIDTVASLGYPPNKDKGTSGASCTSASCHSDGYNVVTTPAWGTSSPCNECHLEVPTTGSHTVHVSVPVNAVCGDCHTGAVQGTTAPTAGHRNGTREADGNCNDCHNDGQSGNDADAGLVGASPTTVPSWGTDAPACGACHVAVPSSAKHNEHLGLYGRVCGDCHDTAGDGSTLPTANHLNGQIDVRAATNYTAAGTPGNGWGSCDNSGTGCHDGIVRNWDASTPDCNSCHGQSTLSGYPVTSGDLVASPTPTGEPLGAHAVHIPILGGDTGNNNPACNVCHNGHNMPVPDNKLIFSFTGIAAKTANAKFDATTPTSGGYALIGDVITVSANRTCANMYCHDPSGTGNRSPQWDGSLPDTAECDSCHGGNASSTATAGLGPMTSGSHTAHIGAGGYECAQCHDATVDVASDRTIPPAEAANHVNGTKNISIIEGGNFAGNTCDTQACHGSFGSPAWGTNFAGVDSCTRCHGTPSAAPATEAQIGPATGAHQAHLASALADAVTCDTCHIVPGSVLAVGHIQDGTAGLGADSVEVNGTLVGGRASGLAVMTPTFTDATNTCSTWCHGSNIADGSNTTPDFYNSNYLAGTGKAGGANGDCSVCHGNPPASKAAHTTVTWDMDCSSNSCHPHNGSGAQHVNGVVEANGNCDSCHNYSPSDWTAPTLRPELAVEGVGAHAKHITELMSPERRNIATLDPAQGLLDGFGAGQNLAICGVCHTNDIAEHMTPEPTRLINFDGGNMEFSFDGVNPPVYLGTPGTSSNVNPPNNEKRCSNVSCHFQDTPLWGNPNP